MKLAFYLCAIALAPPIWADADRKSLIERSEKLPGIEERHRKFVEEVTRFLDASPAATLDKLVPYMPCVDFQRNVNKLGKAGDIDFAEVICNDPQLLKNQEAIQRMTDNGGRMLAVLERTNRLLGILSQSISQAEAYLRGVGVRFKTKCGIDEKCLEEKQLGRLYQIRAAALLRLNLLHVKRILPKYVELPNYRESIERITDTSIKRMEGVLTDVSAKLRSKEDLPW